MMTWSELEQEIAELPEWQKHDAIVCASAYLLKHHGFDRVNAGPVHRDELVGSSFFASARPDISAVHRDWNLLIEVETEVVSKRISEGWKAVSLKARAQDAEFWIVVPTGQRDAVERGIQTFEMPPRVLELRELQDQLTARLSS